MDLKAKKSFRYRGRALKPQDDFNASRQHGRVLVATGRAELADLGSVTHPRVEVMTKRAKTRAMDHDRDGAPGGSRRQPNTTALQEARAEYFQVLGKRAFNGWTLTEVQSRIAEHKAQAS